MSLLAALRCAFAALLFCTLVSQQSVAWPVHGAAPTNFFGGGGIQINRFGHSYYTSVDRWINWWAQSDTITVVSSLNGTVTGKAAWDALGASSQPYFNLITGQLNIPVQTDVTSYGRGVFTAPDGVVGAAIPNAVYGLPGAAPVGAQGKWWLGAVFNLEWTGTISTSGSKITNTGSYGTGGSPGLGTIGGCGTNCATVTFGNAAAANNLALFFTIDASNRSDPPRNIKFYPSQFSAQIHSADLATSLINPDWLAQYGNFGGKPIGKIRWMTETGEINVNGMTDYSQLAEYTYDTFGAINSFPGFARQTYPAGFNSVYGPKGSIGPQTVCIVQNKLGAHAHYTLPWGANGTFGTQVAQTFDACINPGLIVEYEYCNEIWNFGAAFQCFFYLNSQAWPPIGASAPYQQAINVSSITAGATTTINTATPHGLANGATVGIAVNTSDTIASVLNNTAFVISGVTTNSFVISANTTGLSYSSGGTTYTAGGAVLRGGYNSAKLMNQIYAAYGTSKRARWKGDLGGQLADINTATSAINGVMFYVNNESVGSGACSPNLCINDLFDKLVVAPYSGNTSYNGTAIQNITQNTASGSTVVTAAGHSFTNGQTIRIYAKTGMTQIDNTTATVSNVGSGTFNINVNTTGYSAWVSHTDSSAPGCFPFTSSCPNGNFAIDNALPKASDDSIAFNGSNPAQYPTKYSYFAEQMTDAILNGTSVSNPSFGYTIVNFGNYRSYASCGTACLPGLLLAHANLAGSYKLTLDEYEASSSAAYLDTNGLSGSTNITTINAANSGQLWDFFINYAYDAGTSVHQPAEIQAAHIVAGQAAGVAFPSLFTEEGSNPGPFAATRYFGDVPSIIGPILTKNNAGPYILPKPAKTWTVSNMYPTAAANRSQKIGTVCSSCTDTFTPMLGTVATQVVVAVSDTGSGAGSAPTQVQCDTQGGGSVVTLTQYALNTTSGVTAIYIGALAANASSTRTCAITYSGGGQSFQNREYYAFTVSGLTSVTPTAQVSGITQSGIAANNFAADTDSLVITVASRPGFAPLMSGTTTPTIVNPATATIASDIGTTAGYGLFNPSWGAQLMNAWSASSNSGPQSTAVFH